MGRGLGRCILYSGNWNVIEVLDETLCSYTCIIYALYIELVVIYTFIIKKKRNMGKHNS